MRRVATMIFLAILALLVLSPVSAGAESPQSVVLRGVNAVPSPGFVGAGLLNLSRFDLQNSLSYSMVSSSAGGTASGGLWVTSLGYRASENLRLAADVGVFLDPSGDRPVLGQNSIFLRSLEMSYRAGDNFQLHVSYVNLPAAASRVFRPYGVLGPVPGASPWGVPSGPDR